MTIGLTFTSWPETRLCCYIAADCVNIQLCRQSLISATKELLKVNFHNLLHSFYCLRLVIPNSKQACLYFWTNLLLFFSGIAIKVHIALKNLDCIKSKFYITLVLAMIVFTVQESDRTLVVYFDTAVKLNQLSSTFLKLYRWV